MKRLLDEPIAPELREMLRAADEDAPAAPVQRQDEIIAAIAAASTAGSAATVAAADAGRLDGLASSAKWCVPLLGVVVAATFAVLSGSSAPTMASGTTMARPVHGPEQTQAHDEAIGPPTSTASGDRGVRVEDLPTASVPAQRPAPRAEGEVARTAVQAGARPAPAPAPNIDAEIAAIDAARAALTSERAADALARVQSYRSAFADPHFADEADAIEVQALAKLGRKDEARHKAEQFLERRALSPYAQRVRSAAALK